MKKNKCFRKQSGLIVLVVLLFLIAQTAFAAGKKEEAAAGRVQLEYMLWDNGRYATTVERNIPLRELGKMFNVDWELVPVPSSDYNARVAVVLASGDLPDMMVYPGRDWPQRVSEWGRDGFFLDLMPHLDKMPNLVANYLEAVPDALRNSMSDDGKLFYIGRYKTTTALNFSPGFSYRKDVFDRHNMTPGVTFDDFYENLVQLKRLFPDKYPFSAAGGVNGLVARFSTLFETGVGVGFTVAPLGVYYNYWSDDPKWENSVNDNYRQMLIFLNRLYNEGLMHPEFGAGYEQLIVNSEIHMGLNSSFVTPDTVTRAARTETGNQEFIWMYTHFPSFTGPGKQNSFLAVDAMGKLISARTRHAERIFEVIDYMSSDRYHELQLYGVEGETFVRNTSGVPQFMGHLPQWTDRWLLGLGEDYSTLIGHPPGHQEAANAVLTQEQLKFYSDTDAGLPDVPYLNFTDAEMRIIRETDALNTYLEEMALKFIRGEESFNNWNAFVDRTRQLGIDRRLDVYNQATERWARRLP